jgi:uncharacterized protein
MMYGIPEKSDHLILFAMNRFTEIESAAIYGSRATGNYKNGSDIDLVVYAEISTNKLS